MSTDVFLLGTSHSFQAPDHGVSNEHIELFKAFVSTLCAERGIKYICEEMSIEVLRIRRLENSKVREVAMHLRVQHQYCDPTTVERSGLGINVEEASALRAKLHVEVFNEMDADDLEHTECEVDRESFRRYLASEIGGHENSQRELFWMRSMEKLNLSPILFVLGANHIDTFTQLLRTHNYKVTLIEADWKPVPLSYSSRPART